MNDGDLMAALAKIMPMRVADGPDCAEVYFSDGESHSTQAMTMNPQDWIDIQQAYDAAANTRADAKAGEGTPAAAPPVKQSLTSEEDLREAIARIIAAGSHGDPWWWKDRFDDGSDETAVRLRTDDVAIADEILAALQPEQGEGL